MNAHFCRVGKKTPNLRKMFSLKELERNYYEFMEQAYNVMQSDVSLSDTLFYEASKLKRRILNIKGSNSNDLDTAF